MKLKYFASLLGFGLLVAGCRFAVAAPASFGVVSPELNSTLPPIVLPYDDATKTGFDWVQASTLQWFQDAPALRAAQYLREAVHAMTGRELPVQCGQDFSHGIVLTTLAFAPEEIRSDAAVQKALRTEETDDYNAKEAFYIRTEQKRVLLVANAPEGLVNAVVALTQSVGYEVLGMGPNWVHVPDYSNKPLLFNLERADRPGFYIRNLGATSGQSYGVGTLTEVVDESDESVFDSYWRWKVGTHMASQSMPGFPGHALQAYHKAVLDRMRAAKTSDGFLVAATTLGTDTERPAASAANKGHLWINTDAENSPAAGQVYLSDGEKWDLQNPTYISANMDLSLPLVREVILDDFKSSAQAHFNKSPDDIFVFGTDPEDGGGYERLGELLSAKNWYPEYLQKEGVTFGQPYVLNGFKGLNQPREMWDANAPSDTVFGFNNWLLREFDKYIDSLPVANRVTATGKSKKSLVRASLYSYSNHDVPPNFNLDPRIRVMIASYPQNRGWGKWQNFKTQADMAQAFKVMLPREPSGDYWIISLSYYRDYSSHGITGSPLPSTIARRIRETYAAGFRALSVETDFNFGKQGLEYYLYTKMLWNPMLTDAELEALRDRWLQRAFGAGWHEMREYSDFMARENFLINAPNNWAKAIRFIEAADAKIADDSAEQKRLDDVKQFWYFYYLTETNQAEPSSRAFREFIWKGQMSYMTAINFVTRRFFGTNSAAEAAGEEFSGGPAHYTHTETQKWWHEILDEWQVTPVSDFAAQLLANGTTGRAVDVNDVVAVREFGDLAADVSFIYNGGSALNEIQLLTVANQPGEQIGFQLFWPYWDSAYQRGRDVFYGISRWNPRHQEWDTLVDENMISSRSQLAVNQEGVEFQRVEVRYPAKQSGTYKITVMNAGDSSRITSLDYNFKTGEYSGARPYSYLGRPMGHTQSPVYFYIPKGTKSLDMEVYDTYNNKKLQLYSGLPATGQKPTRVIDVSKRGTHTLKLEAGEDGTIAELRSDGFAFPFLYSVPMLWAKSPATLIVPRAIAQADGLTIIE